MIYKHDLDLSLKLLLEILDGFTKLFFGEEITITSAIRPVGKTKSYHPLGLAVDLRTKGVDPLAVILWSIIIKFANDKNHSIGNYKGEFTYLHEDKGGDNEHFHLQLKIGDPI